MTDKVFIQKAGKVVAENMGDPDFCVEAFAHIMSLSRVQLHRRMRALFHQSSSEFIRSRRLNHAASLLRAKNDNISSVAKKVGFRNMSYFSKCFQKQFGFKPSEYC